MRRTTAQRMIYTSLFQPPLFLSTKLQCKVFLEVCMPVARERWEFIVYVGAAVFVFTCKMLVFVLMAEGWLRDSGPINFSGLM